MGPPLSNLSAAISSSDRLIADDHSTRACDNVRQMIVSRRWYWALLGIPVALALACGSDESTPIAVPSGGSPFETLSPPPSPTPLSEIECPAPIPSVSLQADGSVQTAVPLSAEWVGKDCSSITREFFYVPGEALFVTASHPPTLVLAQEPVALKASAWIPDLSGANRIEGGELAIPMASANQGRRSIASQLSLDATSEQALLLSELEPGEYIIEIVGTWPDGLATVSLRIVVT